MKTALRTLPAALLLVVSACGGTLLEPDAAQGIDGLVLVGPQCPVVRQDDPCPDAPYQAWIVIRDASGDFVGRVRSATDGTFRAGLAPGDYVLHPESGSPFPTAGPLAVSVSAGTWTEVLISFDSGIR